LRVSRRFLRPPPLFHFPISGFPFSFAVSPDIGLLHSQGFLFYFDHRRGGNVVKFPEDFPLLFSPKILCVIISFSFRSPAYKVVGCSLCGPSRAVSLPESMLGVCGRLPLFGFPLPGGGP